MVHLVLDADGVHALGDLVDRIAVIVHVLDADTVGALYLVEHGRHGQTALFIGLQRVGRIRQDRIDEEFRGRLFIRLGQVHHDDALGHADLDRRQADAVGGVHGVQHVVHERTKIVINLFNRLGDFLQDRIRDGANFTYSHEP